MDYKKKISTKKLALPKEIPHFYQEMNEVHHYCNKLLQSTLTQFNFSHFVPITELLFTKSSISNNMYPVKFSEDQTQVCSEKPSNIQNQKCLKTFYVKILVHPLHNHNHNTHYTCGWLCITLFTYGSCNNTVSNLDCMWHYVTGWSANNESEECGRGCSQICGAVQVTLLEPCTAYLLLKKAAQYSTADINSTENIGPVLLYTVLLHKILCALLGFWTVAWGSMCEQHLGSHHSSPHTHTLWIRAKTLSGGYSTILVFARWAWGKSQNPHPSYWDSNIGPPNYQARVLSTQQGYSIHLFMKRKWLIYNIKMILLNNPTVWCPQLWDAYSFGCH
jgi:hypothetical protein